MRDFARPEPCGLWTDARGGLRASIYGGRRWLAAARLEIPKTKRHLFGRETTTVMLDWIFTVNGILYLMSPLIENVQMTQKTLNCQLLNLLYTWSQLLLCLCVWDSKGTQRSFHTLHWSYFSYIFPLCKSIVPRTHWGNWISGLASRQGFSWFTSTLVTPAGGQETESESFRACTWNGPWRLGG